MSFITQAVESIKSNRKLLRENTNRFRQRQVPKRIPKKGKNNQKKKENSWKIKLADEKRQKKIIIQLSLIAFFSIHGTIILFQIGSIFFGDQLTSYQEEMKNLEVSTTNTLHKDAYFTQIKRGNRHLENREWQAAQYYFNQALTIFPNGKKANLGLTKSLIYQCKYEKKYCDEALAYFNQLNKSGIYSEATINDLGLLIQNTSIN